MIFFISSVAETNRAPFDLAEAESELVSGFMTEHAAGIFVFFFLAEYASIILMWMLISIVLLGGYEIFGFIYLFHLPFVYIIDIFNYIVYYIYPNSVYQDIFNYIVYYIYPNSVYQDTTIDNMMLYNTLFVEYILNNSLLSLLYSSSLAYKTYIMVFLFILVRAAI